MEKAGPPDVLQTYSEARAFLEQLKGDFGNGETVDNGLWVRIAPQSALFRQSFVVQAMGGLSCQL
jgi:hypothetical protein